MENEVFTAEFQRQLSSDGWLPDYIADVADEIRLDPEIPLSALRSRFTDGLLSYSDEQLRSACNIKTERDLLMIQKAITKILEPWTSEEIPDLPCNVIVLELSRSLPCFTPDKIIGLITKNALDINVNGSTYRVSLSKDATQLPVKKIIRESRYESRRPGRKRVEKAGFQRERFRKKLNSEDKRRRTLRFDKIEDNTELAGQNTRSERIQLFRAKQVFRRFTELGPFYGKGEKGKTPPTFLVSCEPLSLPASYAEEYAQIGRDLFALAKAIWFLPAEYKQILGANLQDQIPLTFRIDSIIDDSGRIYINEIEPEDGADALMTGEQLAYGLRQDLIESTAWYYVKAIRERLGTGPLQILWIQQIADNPYITNTIRMKEFLGILDPEVQIAIVDPEKALFPDLTAYSGIINYSCIPPTTLIQNGVSQEKILSYGSYNTLGNKGLFALLSLPELSVFWNMHLGIEAFVRLQKSMIPSVFIADSTMLETTLKSSDQVAKIFTFSERRLLECARGVYGPWNRDSSQNARELLSQGAKFISQQYIVPKRFDIPLLKSGKIATESRYNRICVKYVITGNQIYMTAVEATLGRNIVPAGRDCCFVPVVFV